MKFKLGPIDSDSAQPDSNRENIKGMSVWEFQIKAIPIGIIAAIVIGFLWSFVISVNAFIGEFRFPDTVIIFTLCLIGTLIIHEFLHFIAHPRNGNPDDSVIGFWPSRLFLYAQYNGKTTRRQSCTILMMPFTIISILPLLISMVTMKTTYWIVYISILNAYLSSGDLFLTIRTLRDLPSKADSSI